MSKDIKQVGNLTPELEDLLEIKGQEKAAQVARRNTKAIYGAGLLGLAALMYFIGGPDVVYNVIPHLVAAQDLYTTGNMLYATVSLGVPIGLGAGGIALEVATIPNMIGIRGKNEQIREINSLRR